MRTTNLLADLVPAVQLAQSKAETQLIVSTAQLAALIDLYYDAEEQIAELEDEVQGLVRQVEGGA